MTARLRRRAFLAAGAAALGAGQWLSLRGEFDHRSCAPTVPASLDALPQLAAEQADLFHVGHSTHLIRVGGLRVLTDPWFFDPGHGGMWHRTGPAVAPHALGALDVVLITHEHPDHADPVALDRMDKRALVVAATPELETRARSLGFRDVARLTAWSSLAHRGLEIHAVPALHDVYEVGYVLRSGAHSVYFAGDSALHDDLPAIAERFAPTTAILPVDGTRLRTEPRLVMDPHDAVLATRALRPELVVTSHADARFFDPVLSLWAVQVEGAAARFARAIVRAGVHARCATPAVGERVELPPRAHGV